MKMAPIHPGKILKEEFMLSCQKWEKLDKIHQEIEQLQTRLKDLEVKDDKK